MEPDTGRRKVLLLERDRQFARHLCDHLEPFGYDVEAVESEEQLQEALSRDDPDALIADVIPAGDDLSGPARIEALMSAANADVPVLYISERSDFQARLAAIRAGGEAYLTKPFDVAPLIDRLDALTRRQPPIPHRVLIVEDDVFMGQRYAAVLRREGIDVMIADRPLKVMDLLADFKPELILLDLYLPQCSGLELARMIRQHDAYLGTPIVFLSVEQDFRRQFQALRTGGDDFLTKPISDEKLLSWVRIRASRARSLNALMAQDSLTGLLVHTRIKDRLASEFSLAERQDQPVSFAMIDLDRFKDINDRHGHMLGDHVLKNLARMLQQRLRDGDSVGRYGGEEFAVVLPGCGPDAAREIVDDIRERFARLRHGFGDVEFNCSFSAGIAGYPDFPDLETLRRAADVALYDAKRQGRDRVCVARSPLLA